jgi:hypothetical protein
MTHDEVWLRKYQGVMRFIETNHRNPSRHDPEERGLYLNRLKQNRKLMNAGKMKEERVEKFKALLELTGLYRRKNQYSEKHVKRMDVSDTGPENDCESDRLW